MTDVPEHLLRRSRERRSAGDGDSGDAGEAPAADAPATDTPASSGEAAPVPATQAPVGTAAEPAPPPPPPPPYVEAAQRRAKIPVWAAPVLAILPLWALIYAGALTESGEALDPVLAEGQQIFAAQCAGCHGGGGGGGSGPPLTEVNLTFSDPQQHLDWVVDGSPAAGTPYGDPDRPGGQKISQQGFGAMPGFGNALTDEEVLAVVRYEREVIGGEEEPTLAEGAEGEGGDDD
ncbi:MAG TPA: c-type cytochrome [Acidimicrobiales bacterium]|nr:c-type cytochrome [Acidimicrobiales bacterium]